MDGLEAEAYDRQYSDSQLVRRILGYFRPQARLIGIVSVAIVLASLVDMLLPVYISANLDELQRDVSSVNVEVVALGIGGLAVLSWLFYFVRRRLSYRAIGDVVLKLREDAFNAVTERDMSFYDQFPSGKIVSRVTADTQQFSQVVSLAIDLVSQTLLIVLLLIYLFHVNTQLT